LVKGTNMTEEERELAVELIEQAKEAVQEALGSIQEPPKQLLKLLNATDVALDKVLFELTEEEEEV
jgi:hypothetical protein